MWIRRVPPGTPPVPATLRNISRAGRLRWLTGRRSTEENWDAFEALTGKPLAILAQTRQSWREARFWLYDLGSELSAAAKDGTLPPVLTLDRVWITATGRAKSPRFSRRPALPAWRKPPRRTNPAASFLAKSPPRYSPAVVNHVAPAGSEILPAPAAARAAMAEPTAQTARRGRRRPHAGAIIPTVGRDNALAAGRHFVAGCLAGPILHMFDDLVPRRWQHRSRANPGVMELSALLREHATANSRWMKNQPHPTDRQFAIYIAAHYRNLVTNEAAWTSPLNMTLVKGDARKFAEQSVAQFPAPTKAEVSEADAALKKTASQPPVIDFLNNPRFLFFAGVGTIVIYVRLPALIAALAFRGGLVLLIARVTFVKKNGDRACAAPVLADAGGVGSGAGGYCCGRNPKCALRHGPGGHHLFPNRGRPDPALPRLAQPRPARSPRRNLACPTVSTCHDKSR